jgi:hypothetical protein
VEFGDKRAVLNAIAKAKARCEGSAVRLRSGKLQRAADADSLDTASRLGRDGIEPAGVTNDIVAFTELVAAAGGTVGRGLPAIEERDLFPLRKRVEANPRQEMPDMILFYAMQGCVLSRDCPMHPGIT